MAINHLVPTGRLRRRGLPRIPRRVAALAVAGLACGPSAVAQAAAGARVDVGSRSVTVSAGQIAAAGEGGTYTLRTGPGRSSRIPLRGMSIRSVLTAAGVDPNTVTSVTVGGASQLSPADIVDPPPFLDGPALVGVAGGRSFYFRPVRDASDVNASDYQQTPPGLPIDVVVAGGTTQPKQPGGPQQLMVAASAAPTTVAVGTRVSFAALVESQPAGSQLSFSWSFGDGGVGFTQTPSHAYTADGDYPAAVTVSAGQGQSVVATVNVHVGHPHRTTRGTGLGSSNANGSGAGGVGSGKGGTGGGNGTGGRGVTQPKASAKPAVKQPVQPAHPVGTVVKAASAPARPGAVQPIRGVLLADAGSPLDLTPSPPPPSGSPGAAHKSAGGASGIGAVVGGLALALTIAGLGGISERRRGMLRPA